MIARILDGDREAYRSLVERYGALAHRTAVVLGAGADADDVVQEAFVKAYRALSRFRRGDPFRPWLLRIVANETHNSRRGRRRAVAAYRRLPIDVPTDDPAEQAMLSVRRRELLRAMAELRAADRDVLACRYLLSLSEAETAAVLDIPRGTVKSRTARALTRLRSILVDAMEVRDV